MKKRPQLNLTPPKELLARLEKLAETYKRDPTRKNEIALEVIKEYLPLWELAAAAHVEYVNKQRMDAALLALRGAGVTIIASHADTAAPAARAIKEMAGDSPTDEVEQISTDESDEKALRREQQKNEKKKKSRKKAARVGQAES